MDGHREIVLDEEDGHALKTLKEDFTALRSTINKEIPRLRSIGIRYGMEFSSNWMYRQPTQQLHQIHNNTYVFSFDDQGRAAIVREIELIDGAVAHDVQQEGARLLRPLYVKLWADYLFPAVRWIFHGEHSKITITGFVIIIVVLFLRIAGVDLKTLTELVKTIRGEK